MVVTNTSERFEGARERLCEDLGELHITVDRALEEFSAKVLETKETGVYESRQARALVNLGAAEPVLSIIAADIEQRGAEVAICDLAEDPGLLFSLVRRGKDTEVMWLLGQIDFNSVLAGRPAHNMYETYQETVLRAVQDSCPAEVTVPLCRVLLKYADVDRILEIVSSSYPSQMRKVGSMARDFLDEALIKYPSALKGPVLRMRAQYYDPQECFDVWYRHATRGYKAEYFDDVDESWLTPVSISRAQDGTHNNEMLDRLSSHIEEGFNKFVDCTNLDSFHDIRRLSKSFYELAESYPTAANHLLKTPGLSRVVTTIIEAPEINPSDDYSRVILSYLKGAAVLAGLEDKFPQLADIPLPKDATTRAEKSYDVLLEDRAQQILIDQFEELAVLGKEAVIAAKAVSADVYENYLRVLGGEPRWVRKLVNAALERNGLFSDCVWDYFAVPLDSRSLEIGKTGSKMYVNLSETSLGNIDKIISSHAAEVWEIASTNLAIRSGDLYIGTEPFLTVEDAQSADTKRVGTRVCGFTEWEMRTILGKVNYGEARHRLVSYLNTAVDLSAAAFTELGLEHGHPHADNFLFEFVRKDALTAEELEDPLILNSARIGLNNVEMNPERWAAAPDDYHVICRVIDFDRARKL